LGSLVRISGLFQANIQTKLIPWYIRRECKPVNHKTLNLNVIN